MWAMVIRAIHGEFYLGSSYRIRRLSVSIWIAILTYIFDLHDRGVDLVECCKRCIGNGANTLCWADTLLGDWPFNIRFP